MRANDEELVDSCLSGDKDAFGKLVIRYQGIVYGLAYHLVGNFEDAKDIAQEAFIRAYTRLSDLRDKTKFASWLKKVTFSVCMNWLKAQGRSELALLGDETNGEDIYEIPDSAPSPAEQVEAEELREAVLQAVNNLPETYRLPLTLFHLDGLSYKKVAEFLDVSVSAVKWRLHQARKMLKKEMLNMVGEVFEEHKPDEKFTEETMEKISVLVADDSLEMRNALIKLLDDEGYDVHGAENGEEALERLKQTDYQVAIVDSRMPGLDGIELLKQIVEKHPHTAVIVITAYQTIEDAIAAMELGVFDYIAKPISLKEFLPRVQRAIEYRRPAMRTEPCPKCNREMQADWQYCPYDGTKIA